MKIRIIFYGLIALLPISSFADKFDSRIGVVA